MAITFEEFDKICRFCLKTNTVLYSLFEENAKEATRESPLANIFNKSLGFEITAGDGLPQSICDDCINKLMVCQDFCNQCHSATQVLNAVVAEHLGNYVSTEFVSLFKLSIWHKSTKQDPEPVDESISVLNHQTLKTETSAPLDMVMERCTAEQGPKKRIRKKPEYQHCFICGLRCRYLNRHIGIMHSNDSRYECDICGTYCARSKGQLHIHMVAKHINKMKSEFVCDVCDRHFKNLKKLNNHMAAKHPARRHPCPHCHLVFRSERTLNRHRTIHTGERNLICEECGKSFRQTETLRNHQLRHSPPTIPCPHCDRMFYVKSELRNHEGVHTGSRPWKCDICSASFVASSGLTVHRNKHKKEKKFPSCQLCGEQFSEHLGLRMHMNDHRRSLI